MRHTFMNETPNHSAFDIARNEPMFKGSVQESHAAEPAVGSVLKSTRIAPAR